VSPLFSDLPRLPARPFVLIRHGETTANRDQIIAGRLEVELTEAGRDQARALAQLVWPQPLALFTSPMRRARETAALAFPAQPATSHPGLKERDWGIYEGRPLPDLPPRNATPEGGEGWQEMIQRVHAALTACLIEARSNLPVVICHSGVIRVTRLLTGQPSVGSRAPNARPLHYRPAHGPTGNTFEETLNEL